MKNIELVPKSIRKQILNMAYRGSAVHIACSFSIVELLIVLYGSFLRYPRGEYNSPTRDIFVLSKGHGVMAQYACLAAVGWIDQKELDAYFSDGSKLMGLADSRVPGIETSTGSLGHGLSVAVGMALGNKLNSNNVRTFVIVGDGEINEGPIWEAIMFASHHKLGNLYLIVDNNGFQAMGRTDDILENSNLSKKLEAFGFITREVNGHDVAEITLVIEQLINQESDSPKAIIANTVKGYGVSFMEGNNIWHYTRLDDQTYNLALSELENA